MIFHQIFLECCIRTTYASISFCSIPLPAKPLIILAPTDAAFAKFTPQQHVRVKNTSGLVVQVLKAHVLEGKVFSSDLTRGLKADMLQLGVVRFIKFTKGTDSST